jgi:hypothetical protein
VTETLNPHIGLIATFAGVALSYIALIYALYYEKILNVYAATTEKISSIKQNTGFEKDSIKNWTRSIDRRYQILL